MRLLCNGLVVVVATVLVASCATTYDEKLGTRLEKSASAAEQEKATALIAEADASWAERADEPKLKSALAKWEEAVKLAPSTELLTKLARGHFLLGDGHYALVDNVEARDAEYQLGLDWANEALKLSAPEYTAAKASGTKHTEAIKLASKDALAPMYWYAANLGKWAASKGFATRLKYKDDLKATMDHVKALDETFFYAAPWRYFGGYEAATAGIAGGSLEKSKENFEKAITLAPNYFGTKVLYADFLCPKLQKDEDGDGTPDGKKLFEKLLNEVIAADPTVDPAIEAENRLEQKKAKKLLAKVDELF
ncbi:MAG: TRAP transporter TatT component family protein [Deltaproteobacteria bacterium]|nr:TRAP transporter TatT component family protein [Deltaproteobacteria bacterium]